MSGNSKTDVQLRRFATFGFRAIPPQDGSAGADHVAMELCVRLVENRFHVVAYNRLYAGESPKFQTYKGVELVYLKTVRKSGFDSLWHSLKATCHIIIHNTADIVQIHNGGNSIWAVFLRLFGKKVIMGQDGLDWKRDKWPWYGKLFLYISSYITARVPNVVIFDNIYAKESFERKFNRQFHFVPYGNETPHVITDNEILENLRLKPKDYFLFVGRFIPDKGLQYLISAFENVLTEKKLVLVGGGPNSSGFESHLKKTQDKRILFPGYIYGDKVIHLMKNAYAYIQPSDLEGLSPVILLVMGLETPLICSDIRENLFIVADTALTFERGNVDDLKRTIDYAIAKPDILSINAKRAKVHVDKEFSWEKFTNDYIEVFSQFSGKNRE